MSKRLDQKVALVTGASSGIGRAAALAFSREGAAVVLAARHADELSAVAGENERTGGEVFAIPTDIADEDSVKRLVYGALDRFHRLDAAFNSAGVAGKWAPIGELEAADYDLVMSTNVRGTWLMLKHEIAAMSQHGGAIVNASSVAATGGTAGLSIYAASKGAIDSMIRPLAIEAGHLNIRINNVSAGVTKTHMMAHLTDETSDAIARHSALGHIAVPEEIADVAVWLCTHESRFITGQSILADGGFNIAGMRM